MENFERAVAVGTKKKWVKPQVMRIIAGSAEFGSGNVDDGDNGTAQNNS